MALDERYVAPDVEKKWQARWREARIYSVVADPKKPKFYGLEMFPYPSGNGLSVGHVRNYAPPDAFLRYKAMRGYNVLHPMGWDAFGQPAEDEAIRRGRNPLEMVAEYSANYKRQLNLVGLSYDWDREINSSDPEYYRWTQWIFLLLYKRGLAYRASAPVNWCPKDETVLANEQVVNGRCWRCDTPIVKRQMQQWFFRITEYAQRLIDDLDTIDWPEGVKTQQRNWIGKSEGAEVEFKVEGCADTIRIFTTRPDTLWGATLMVLAPEHPLVATITTPNQSAHVEQYVARTQRETEIERLAEGKEKTGVFTGAFAVNPVNGERIPIWIADYVLLGYGTGAIMAVPAHDQRDFEFARKFDLPVVMVYQPADRVLDPQTMDAALIHEGSVVVGPFTGEPDSAQTVHEVVLWIEQEGIGKGAINFKLRDWLISRQRFWGAPIPIVYCPVHGAVPVPADQLPVRLPHVESYKPSATGESPLATIAEFVETTCPVCGGPARRETDTMGGFACSSWYFLRFADPHNQSEPFSKELVDYWLPVDMYVGGTEHAVMHLLYARFWTKVLYDEGLVGFVEPFKALRNQGSMLAWTPGRKPSAGEGDATDDEEQIIDWKVLKHEELAGFPVDKVIWRWARMSKSKGNVITPDEVAGQYGADALHVYEMFVAPFEDDVQWSDEGIRGSARFLGRVWRLVASVAPNFSRQWRGQVLQDSADPRTKALRRKTHQTLIRVANSIEEFRFNTAIAAIMEWVNTIYETIAALGQGVRSPAVDEAVEYLVVLLSPFAPHISDELWQEGLCQPGFLYGHPWPIADPTLAKADEITLVVQVNGKVRDKLTAPADSSESDLREMALASPRIGEWLNGAEPKKVIVVPGKLVNIVV